MAAVVRPLHELTKADHDEEDQARHEHADDDVLALGGRVEDHGLTLSEWRASASATASSSGLPPSARAASTQASPSPGNPSARRAAQRETSSASTATAATPPASATRTSPCAYR